ncbi:hypothetical protein PoHVEF18_009924 [Penicillium ochrochloron]
MICATTEEDLSSSSGYESSDSDYIPPLVFSSGVSSEIIAKCQAAFEGQSIPCDLLDRSPWIRRMLVHAIRKYEEFAKSSEVVELCSRRQYPELARARHARLIMSNIIPDVSDPCLLPYCFWYPEVAQEETYRLLAERYPSLRYQVGRACAVAGYTSLYKSLDLLPEVSIAEEARDNMHLSGEIFEEIVSSPVRYNVLDDYTRTAHEPRAGAYLNGDTCVRSILDFRQPIENLWLPAKRIECIPFDLTEDEALGETASGAVHPPLGPDEIRLLHTPLPLDLPTVNKNLLILMAAYEGNVDRYARLRRPRCFDVEVNCIVRGIYHNTSFAKWWEQEVESEFSAAKFIHGLDQIRKAITARFIMCNDLSRVTGSDPFYYPYMIWYPLLPQVRTLRELLHRIPAMKPQIAHTCIAADYQDIFDLLDVVPTRALWLEAKRSPNKHYVEDLESRAAEQDIDLENGPAVLCDTWQFDYVEFDKEPTSTYLYSPLHAGLVEFVYQGGIYEGMDARMAYVDHFLCSTEDLRKKAADHEAGLWFMYEEE